MYNAQALAHMNGNEIAIIGMAGRFPGAGNIDEFWHNLCNGVESIRLLSDKELVSLGVDSKIFDDRNYVKAVAMPEKFDWFDAAFFGISHKEAELMDPQHRMFLECSWEALENAGHNVEAFQGSVGVYSGTSISTYLLNNLVLNNAVMDTIDNMQIDIGNAADSLSTRVSYKLNLEGPSQAIQTACSTSLVAVHNACQSLLNHECDMALAGGVSINVRNRAGYYYKEDGIESPDGHCRAFDAQAQGTVFGSGVGVVVLKRLEDAIADGDYIYALIKGSAVNNDGSSKVSYTAPSVDGQAKVIIEAIANSGIGVDKISYIETHGTGTVMGDPIEFQALKKAFYAAGWTNGCCALGSVKTNVGHLAHAAGVTGLIKTALALNYKLLPPSLNYIKPNPQIDFENSPFFVNNKLSEWKGNDTPLYAGVSSFGFGGTNSHVILEEAPLLKPSSKSRTWQLLLLSARTSTGLDNAARNICEFLKLHPDINLADVAYTLKVGRKPFNYRRSVVCSCSDKAVQYLESLDSWHVCTGNGENSRSKILFFFPDGRTQYINTGLELYKNEADFYSCVNYCSKILKKYVDYDPVSILYPAEGQERSCSELLKKAEIMQPLLFIIEYSLAYLWMKWGINPDGLFGFGVGELVVACFSHVFSLEDALKFVAALAGAASCMTDYDSLKNIELKEPEIPFISSITGTWATYNQIANIDYWTYIINCSSFQMRDFDILAGEKEWSVLVIGSDIHMKALVGEFKGQTERITICTSLSDPFGHHSDIETMLKALGELWVKCAGVNWKTFHKDEFRYRLPLPTYPFERQRYWIDPLNRENIHRAPKSEGYAEKNIDITDRLFIPVWRRIRLSNQDVRKALSQKNRIWIIFVDGAGFGYSIAEYLKAEKQEVVLVTMGPEYKRKEKNEYEINPDKPYDYITLMKNLPIQNDVIVTILHLWSITGYNQDLKPDCYTQFCILCYNSLIILAQALNKIGIISPVNMAVITNNLYNITEEESLIPEKAVIEAPCKVIPQEFSNFTCRCIDIPFLELPDAKEITLIKNIIADIAGDASEIAVAYRGTQRWVRGYGAIVLENCTDTMSRLRKDGVYLIIDDLENTRFDKAEDLMGCMNSKIIFIKDSDAIREAQWISWQEGDKTSDKYLKLQNLSKMGFDVFTAAVDMTDYIQMKSIIEKTISMFGTINGVIYNGINSNGMLLKTIQEACHTEFTDDFIKMRNRMLLLDQVFSKLKLDFCLIVSSLTSLLGGAGTVFITARHLFIDSFVQFHNAKSGSQWRCINMGFLNEPVSQNHNLSDLLLTSNESIEILNYIINATSESQIIMSSGKLIERAMQCVNIGEHKECSCIEQTDVAQSAYPRPQIDNIYIEPVSKIEKAIAGIWCKVLGVDKVGIDDNFFNLGGDSLQALEVISRLRKELNVSVSVSNLYEGLNIRSLIKLLNINQENKFACEIYDTETQERKERILKVQRYQKSHREMKKEHE